MQIGRQPDSSIGSKFLAISNADIRACLQAALHGAFGSSIELQEMVGRKGKGFLWEANVDTLTVDIPELGGRLTPHIWGRNANDGSTAFTLGLGLFSWVCANGLYVGVTDFLQKIRHIDGPKANSLLDILPAQVAIAAARMASGDLIQVALDALDQKVDDPISIIGNVPGLGKRTRDVSIGHVLNGTHREKDQPTNAWGLYNLLNETNRLGSRTSYTAADKDMGLLDNILVLAADQLAEKVA